MIKALWFKHVTRRLMRRKYRNLSFFGFYPHEFAMVREGLKEVLALYQLGELTYPNTGICFNAGFMRYGSEAPPRKRACHAFLWMCDEFNKTQRKPEFPESIAFTFPFADIDFKNDNRLDINVTWVGESAEVRVNAMKWIIGEIEKYDLHVV